MVPEIWLVQNLYKKMKMLYTWLHSYHFLKLHSIKQIIIHLLYILIRVCHIGQSMRSVKVTSSEFPLWCSSIILLIIFPTLFPCLELLETRFSTSPVDCMRSKHIHYALWHHNLLHAWQSDIYPCVMWGGPELDIHENSTLHATKGSSVYLILTREYYVNTPSIGMKQTIP